MQLQQMVGLVNAEMPFGRVMGSFTFERQSSMFCACERWTVDVNRMERDDLTKKGYMRFSVST
jgi:hypothetical protein